MISDAHSTLRDMNLWRVAFALMVCAAAAAVIHLILFDANLNDAVVTQTEAAAELDTVAPSSSAPVSSPVHDAVPSPPTRAAMADGYLRLYRDELTA